MKVTEHNDARDKGFVLQGLRESQGYESEVSPLTPARRSRLHLNQVAVVALLVMILIAASGLVFLITYWIGH